MVKRKTFEPAFCFLLFCFWASSPVEAARLVGIEANGNTVIDQSESNVVVPIIRWVNANPVTVVVELDASDTASDIVLALESDDEGKPRWYGFQIELGDGATWAGGRRSSPIPWQINYLWYYPFVAQPVTTRVDATTVVLGFAKPITKLRTTGTKSQLDRDISAGKFPWRDDWYGVAWLIDRRGIPANDGFRLRFRPLLASPPPCSDREIQRFDRIDRACDNALPGG